MGNAVDRTHNIHIISKDAVKHAMTQLSNTLEAVADENNRSISAILAPNEAILGLFKGVLGLFMHSHSAHNVLYFNDLIQRTGIPHPPPPSQPLWDCETGGASASEDSFSRSTQGRGA